MGDSRDGKRLTISELAGEFGVAPSAIRYYEEVGLLKPGGRTSGGQRLYGDRERARLKLILRGRRFGFSLAEIREILELYDADPTQTKQIIRTLEYGFRHIQEIDEKLSELLEIREEMLDFAKYFLEILRQNGKNDPEVRYFLKTAGRAIRRLEEKGKTLVSTGKEASFLSACELDLDEGTERKKTSNKNGKNRKG